MLTSRCRYVEEYSVYHEFSTSPSSDDLFMSLDLCAKGYSPYNTLLAMLPVRILVTVNSLSIAVQFCEIFVSTLHDQQIRLFSFLRVHSTSVQSSCVEVFGQ